MIFRPRGMGLHKHTARCLGIVFSLTTYHRLNCTVFESHRKSLIEHCESLRSQCWMILFLWVSNTVYCGRVILVDNFVGHDAAGKMGISDTCVFSSNASSLRSIRSLSKAGRLERVSFFSCLVTWTIGSIKGYDDYCRQHHIRASRINNGLIISQSHNKK